MRRNGEGKPVVALDFDGTLGDYHGNFFRFASLYFGPQIVRDFPPIDKPNPGEPLWEHLGISHRDYRDAKLAYRQGGWKRWMPIYKGAAELTKGLRAEGIEVWICTTRPYLRLDNVDPDTRESLERNGIQYDALLFDPAHEEDGTKYDELRRQAGLRVAAIVDDLPEMIESARDAFGGGTGGHSFPWLAPILREQPYNQHYKYPRRAASCEEIWDLVYTDVNTWRGWNR